MGNSIEIKTLTEKNSTANSNRFQLLRDIREAVSDSERDYTQGSIGKAILLLSIPMVLEMVMESVFAVVDIFFVSRLGSHAVAAVGLTESMLTIAYAIAIGLAMATTAMVARRIGEKDREAASIASFQAILVSLMVATPIALIGIFLSEELLKLMGAAPAVIESGSGYTLILISFNAVIMLLFVINAIFRGAGDAVISMRVLAVANGLNIVLDPCFILGLGPFPELGVTGAAVATTIGRGIGVLYQFISLAQNDRRIVLSRQNLKPDFGVMKKLLRLSLGGISQFIIATSSWIGIVRIMATFGSASIGGYTIAIRVVMFSILPAWGMSNAAATLVGQNLGAGEPDRAEKSVWHTALINVMFLSCVGMIFYTTSEFIISFFTSDAAMIAIGAQCLRYVSFGYPFYAFGMVIGQAFNGAGDTATPTKMNFICFWLIEIPLACLLALNGNLILSWGLGLREPGVFIALVIGESLLGIIGVLLFRRGKWKEKQV